MNRDDRVIEEFRRRRTRQLVVSLPALVPLVFFATRGDGQSVSILGFSESAVVGLFIVLVVGILIFSFFNWRCPSCDRYLGRGINPTFCSKCGVRLNG
jgi:hypothetical protein